MNLLTYTVLSFGIFNIANLHDIFLKIAQAEGIFDFHYFLSLQKRASDHSAAAPPLPPGSSKFLLTMYFHLLSTQISSMIFQVQSKSIPT